MYGSVNYHKVNTLQHQSDQEGEHQHLEAHAPLSHLAPPLFTQVTFDTVD